MTAAQSNNESAPLIILADDDPSIRLILHHILQRDGYRVLDASNGREVLQLHQQTPADLILLDAIMPEQDGFVTCRMLKEQQPELPVLLVTALDDDQSVEHAFRVGADDYISKPINWAVLKHRIARALTLLSPLSMLDEKISNNQINTEFTPRMNLASEVCDAIEIHSELPLHTFPSMQSMGQLLKRYALSYQQAKYLHNTAHIMSIPLWPVRRGATQIIDQLHALEKNFGITLNQLEIRIQECHLHEDSMSQMLPLLSKLPLQLCIDDFSFSIRDLDFMRQYGFTSAILDVAKTRKRLGNASLWLNDAAKSFHDGNLILHASGVRQPEDMQLAISLNCVSASGSAIKPKTK